MSFALNVCNWGECSGVELWAMNLRQSYFVAQGDKMWSPWWETSLKDCSFSTYAKFSEKVTFSTQVFSCKIFKIFKNTYFEEHLRTAASTLYMFSK